MPATIQSPVGAEIVIDGRRFVSFAGSSYLGLSGRPEILDAASASLRENGAGYQFHRCYDIATQAHQDVEREAAEFFGTDAALYVASGYYFGLIGIAALRDRFDAIFFDELAHFSLRDAIAASGLPNYAFRHVDVQDLEANLRRHLQPRGRPLVVTDAMYSTLGEIAPLAEFASVLTQFGGQLLVDESHGFGVLGESGRGGCEHHRISVDARLAGGSTGKAIGVIGGLIVASEREVAAFRLTPAGRGASAGLPAAAAMCAASLRYIRAHPELLARSRANTAYLKTGMRKLGLDIPNTISPVATFSIAGSRSMKKLQRRLMDEGILVLHSTYIGAGAAGVIRCGIFADHTSAHLDQLLDSLRRLL
jgi:8-amino-7-oxononanoate synthase